MRARLAALALIIATACLRDTSLPMESVGGRCHVDSDCAKGLCDLNGSCDKGKCRSDSNCENDICVGGTASQVGHCAVLECKVSKDCGFNRRCTTNPNTRETSCIFGCDTDEGCEFGICQNMFCNTYFCHTAAQCQSGLCLGLAGGLSGYCGAKECDKSADCDGGRQCITNAATLEKRCISGCLANADCAGPCDECVGTNHFDIPGTCDAGGLGPALVGTATALKMRDNLAAAASYVRQRDPDAFLTQINGLSIKADGTVDVTLNYVSNWLYGFQVGDGGTVPARMVSVQYSKQAGALCGSYSNNATNLSPREEVPDAVWMAYKDSTVVTSAFKAEPGCIAPAQTVQDSIIYNVNGGAPWFYLGTWKGHSYVGNPVSLVATATCN